MSLDPETLAYVGAHEELLDGLLEGDRPAILATLGRSIRVRGGRIDVPGGRAAVTAWESIIQQHVTEPEPFIFDLLDRDRGRAALLYDAIDHFDPARQAFALGLRVPEGGARTQYLRALYDACVASLTAWDPHVRPFRRVSADPIHLLAVTRVLPSGELPQPAGRQFWSAALSRSELSAEAPRLLALDSPDSTVDAGWLVEQVCVDNRRNSASSRSGPGSSDSGHFATSRRPTSRTRSSPSRGSSGSRCSSSRSSVIGVTDPATYASAVRHAQRLSEIGDREAAGTALRQFQGALAILERIRFSRAIPAEVALGLVRTLTAVPLTESGAYRGGVAMWVETHLLPALATVSEARAAAAGTTVSAEATLLASMAGPSSGIHGARRGVGGPAVPRGCRRSRVRSPGAGAPEAGRSSPRCRPGVLPRSRPAAGTH